MHSHVFVLLLSAVCCLVAAEKSFLISAYRDSANDTHPARKGAGSIHGKIKALYWYGKWTVGAEKGMVLLIDTGSTDLILPKNRYVPYHEKPYPGDHNFTTEYEGVNRAGFGFQQTNGTVRLDRVKQGHLSVAEQAIGEVESTKFFDVKTPPHLNLSAGHGIIGFAGVNASGFTPKAPGWFDNLCTHKSIDECRFGMAFGTNGTGQVVVGKLESQLVDGSLTIVPLIRSGGFFIVNGDVFLNGKSLFQNQTFILDVGTDNLQSPLGPAQKISKMLGFKTVIKTGANLFDPKVPVKNLFAYYNCENPPTIGFGFPPQAALTSGQKQVVFDIPNTPAIWDVYKNKNGNCTSILGGTNALASQQGEPPLWLIGQPFFQGHYLDFNVGQGMMGFGNLKNPATGT